MFEATVKPHLCERLGVQPQAGGRTHRFRVAGRSEGELDASLEDLFSSASVETTVLCGSTGIEIHLLERSTGEPSFESVRDQIRQRLGEDLFSEGEMTLAQTVGANLARRGERLAAAESCTAGMLAAELGGISGASEWFQGGVVCYANEVKIALLGVDASTLEIDGAVSQAVAEQLATGVCRVCNSDWGIGITGIAGPAGGSADKPVGTVHVAVAEAGGAVHHWSTLQLGDRELIRRRSAFFALDQLRRLLIQSDR
jgi:nicotinamide-nucleotide amidase